MDMNTDGFKYDLAVLESGISSMGVLGDLAYHVPWVRGSRHVFAFYVGFMLTTRGFRVWGRPFQQTQQLHHLAIGQFPTYRLGASAVGPSMGTNGTELNNELYPKNPSSRCSTSGYRVRLRSSHSLPPFSR